jgi:putative glutamine amidotransferase
VQHESKDGWTKGFHKHLVKFDKGTLLGDLYTVETLDVPTAHHQAILELGEGWRATAFAEDGVIEGIEMPGRPFTIGVQWHPERDFSSSARLFEGLIRSARSGMVSSSPRARKVG